MTIVTTCTTGIVGNTHTLQLLYLLSNISTIAPDPVGQFERVPMPNQRWLPAGCGYSLRRSRKMCQAGIVSADTATDRHPDLPESLM